MRPFIIIINPVTSLGSDKTKLSYGGHCDPITLIEQNTNFPIPSPTCINRNTGSRK